MTNLAQMMKQAQNMQAKMLDLQTRMAAVEVTGTAGNNAVSVIMTGKGNVMKVSITQGVMDDKDMLEDLMVVAINDARAKIDALTQSETEKAMGGLSLPAGLKLPF